MPKPTKTAKRSPFVSRDDTITQLEDIIDKQQQIIQHERDTAKAQLSSRRDPLMDERIKLCSVLGQMIEATSKAIMFIVGKEVV